MLIHHYTNIESLAMILSTKKIRFNRLDRMDDLEEGSVEAQGIPLGKYTYVSCWTEDDEESIPLWNMYAGKEMGVRISLPQDMFQDYSVLDGLIGDEELSSALLSSMPKIASTVTWKIPSSEYLGKTYLILPVYSNNIGGGFYTKIKYVKNVFAVTKDLVNVVHNENGTSDLSLKIGEVGVYKHERWQFQNESRFILRIIPTEEAITLFETSKFVELLTKAMINGILPNIETYDLSLKDEVLDQLEVTLSPSITVGQRVIVESLLKQYAPKAKIKESSLMQCVKMK